MKQKKSEEFKFNFVDKCPKECWNCPYYKDCDFPFEDRPYSYTRCPISLGYDYKDCEHCNIEWQCCVSDLDDWKNYVD